jgi:phage tail sheath protein FI
VGFARYWDRTNGDFRLILAHGTEVAEAGAIVGGKCWINPNFNTPDQLVQGKVTFSFDFEPVAPAEHIVGRAHREPGYYQDLID